MLEKKLVYLAVPYTHKDPKIMEERFQFVNKIAGDLINKGEIIFSPISHCHPIALVCDLPKDWQYWNNFCQAYMSCCHKMYVVMLDGWKESIGIQAEIKIAEEMGIEIKYLKYCKNSLEFLDEMNYPNTKDVWVSEIEALLMV